MSDSLDRQRYELMKRNQATLEQVERILTVEATQVLSLTEQFDQQELGGYLRTVVPGLIDKYGNVNATLAMKYYDEQRLLALQKSSAADRRRGSQREAAAKLKSELYVAGLPNFDPTSLSDPIVNYGMATFVAAGNAPMRDAVTNALTRAVGSYNRDTILYNAGLDDAVLSVQRVAEANACAFCSMVAFGSGVMHARESRVANFAIDFHNNCKCTIETLYAGDRPFRPPHYDQLEQDYVAATSNVGTTDSKRILAEMRRISGRK
jgi:hypothetical protein